MVLNPVTRRDVRRAQRWIFILNTASKEVKLDPFVFAALMLRESGGGALLEPKDDPCGLGDHGWAFGLFQIDKRYHSEFMRSEAKRWPLVQARYACALLARNREALLRSFPTLADGRLTAAMLCAYNAPLYKVRRALDAGADPDVVTTGKNYGSWIMKKAERLRSAEPSMFARAER